MNVPILACVAHLSKPSHARLFSVAAVGVMLALGALLASSIARAAVAGCEGVQVYPLDELTRTATAHPAGTTFCINDGNYSVASNVVVQDGDIFTGVYSDGSRPQIKGTGAEHIFYTEGADGSTIRNVAIKGAVGGDYCEPNCGRGIGGGGSNTLIENVRAYANANQGAGSLGPGAVVRDSRFDHNGNASFSDPVGPRSSAGLKTTSSIKVYNSEFTDNYWNGFWCDVECQATEVHDSVLSRNGKAGLHYEISSGPAVFEGNTIQGNGTLAEANRHTGLIISSSANVDAYGNIFGKNVEYGVEIIDDSRPPIMSNVSVHGNIMNGDLLAGCSRLGVSCYENR
jgi:hypothetical protein